MAYMTSGCCLFPCLSIVLVVNRCDIGHWLTCLGWTEARTYLRAEGRSRDYQNFLPSLGCHFFLPMVLCYLLAFIERAKE